MSSLGIKTGDQVIVLRGKDAGKKGKVIQVFTAARQVVVDGANSLTKNVRARRANEKGQRIQFFAPLDRSNVMLLDSQTGQPTRRRQHSVPPPTKSPSPAPPTKNKTKR